MTWTLPGPIVSSASSAACTCAAVAWKSSGVVVAPLNWSVNVPCSVFVTVIVWISSVPPLPAVVVATGSVGIVCPSALAMMLFSCWIAPAGFWTICLTVSAILFAMFSRSLIDLPTRGSWVLRMSPRTPPLEAKDWM